MSSIIERTIPVLAKDENGAWAKADIPNII
jgi:hypothetical protein